MTAAFITLLTASWQSKTAEFTPSNPGIQVNSRRWPSMTQPLITTGLALSMLSFAGWSIASKYIPREVTSPPIAAPTYLYGNDVAGIGIIEPASEMIALAIERGGVVSRVDVVAGTFVKAGRPLFSIDARNYEANVAQAEALVEAQDAAITSIDQNLILQKDAIDHAVANLDSADAERTRASLEQKRYGVLVAGGWASRQRFESVTADHQKASASVAAARAALAGAKQQAAVVTAQRREAEAKLVQAQAALRGALADLDKTVVKSPVDGVVLKVNVRVGEYAPAGALPTALMTMGSVNPLHVRVDIDETDSWRVRPESPAVARMRGNPGMSVPLSFVRCEPYVLPKKSLSGDTSERVDTRVLQVIYAFAPKDFPAFVGQQVDVFIKAPTRAEGLKHPQASWPSAATPTADRDRTVSRRSEPSSRTTLIGEQPNPRVMLPPQDVMSRGLINLLILHDATPTNADGSTSITAEPVESVLTETAFRLSSAPATAKSVRSPVTNSIAIRENTMISGSNSQLSVARQVRANWTRFRHNANSIPMMPEPRLRALIERFAAATKHFRL
jgi:HlyD family secretion protein